MEIDPRTNLLPADKKYSYNLTHSLTMIGLDNLYKSITPLLAGKKLPPKYYVLYSQLQEDIEHFINEMIKFKKEIDKERYKNIEIANKNLDNFMREF
ncbi:MAG: hypothetical protein ACTSXD_08365 [Candidatus Heimdallarchaeaceae archaeon]